MKTREKHTVISIVDFVLKKEVLKSISLNYLDVQIFAYFTINPLRFIKRKQT